MGQSLATFDPYPVSINGVGASAAPAAGGLESLLGAAPVVGGLVSGGLGLIGGILGNRSAEKAANAQREWQERMRATQYQTAVEDLKKAGLNPMLAYTQGGAGVPSGGQAQTRDVVSPAVASAVSAASAVAQLENVSADTRNKRAQTNNIDSQTLMNDAQTRFLVEAANKTRHEGSSALTRSLIDAETFDSQIKLRNIEVQQRVAELMGTKFGLSAKEAESKFYDGAMGELSKYIQPIKMLIDMLRGR